MMGYYSALIEIVGIRDLAEISPNDYLSKVYLFSQQVEDSVPNSGKSIDIVLIRDFCYAKSQSKNELIEFIRKLRFNLLNSASLTCRGVVKNIETNIKYDTRIHYSSEIKKIEFDQPASQMFGMLEGMKSIALMFDVENSENESYCFKNYFIDSYNKLVFEEFHDIKFSPNSINNYHVDKICHEFERAYNWSPRYARFFLGSFINVIVSTDFNEEENETNSSIDKLLKMGYFNKFKKIKGIGIIYAFFIRLSLESGMYNHESCERIVNILSKLKKNIWLNKYIRESALEELPNRVFNKKTKKKYIDIQE